MSIDLFVVIYCKFQVTISQWSALVSTLNRPFWRLVTWMDLYLFGKLIPELLSIIDSSQKFRSVVCFAFSFLAILLILHWHVTRILTYEKGQD